jgi:hypothetical protein
VFHGLFSDLRSGSAQHGAGDGLLYAAALLLEAMDLGKELLETPRSLSSVSRAASS